jgi:hypothetical protein
MFSQPATPAAAPDPAFPTQLAQKSDPGSFTQMFSKPAGGTPAPRAFQTPPQQQNDFWTGANPPPAAPAGPSPQGGFTQLFQSLNDEGPAPYKPSEAPFSPAPAPAPQATAAPGGGFTQLFRTLNADPAPQARAPIPAAPVPSTPAPAASGPGEYTRVISGSALRELQSAAQAPPPAPAAPTPMTAPPAMFARPAMPAAPPMAMPSAPAAPPMAPQAFSFPPAAPPAPPAAPAPGGLQKHLPLILLVNVFLLVAIVLILFFVLRHH